MIPKANKKNARIMPVSLFSADVNTKCQRFGGITGQEKILVVVFVADEAVEYTP